MKYIKLFENFNLRKPKMITAEEYREKFDTHETENFTQQEIDFFNKLSKDNWGSIYDIDLGKNLAIIQLYPVGDDDNLVEIDITKLKDNWYLIDEPGIDKFLCDEWEEVLGYLGSQTNLKF